MACHDLIMKRLLIRARGSRFYFGHLVLIIIIQLYFFVVRVVYRTTPE